MLARAADWHDAKCIDFFRHGAPLLGVLETSGVGTPVDDAEGGNPDRVLEKLVHRNSKILSQLKDDALSGELLQISAKELELGRLRGPIPLLELDLEACAVATRFGVDQGVC